MSQGSRISESILVAIWRRLRDVAVKVVEAVYVATTESPGYLTVVGVLFAVAVGFTLVVVRQRIDHSPTHPSPHDVATSTSEWRDQAVGEAVVDAVSP